MDPRQEPRRVTRSARFHLRSSPRSSRNHPRRDRSEAAPATRRAFQRTAQTTSDCRSQLPSDSHCSRCERVGSHRWYPRLALSTLAKYSESFTRECSAGSRRSGCSTDSTSRTPRAATAIVFISGSTASGACTGSAERRTPFTTPDAASSDTAIKDTVTVNVSPRNDRNP